MCVSEGGLTAIVPWRWRAHEEQARTDASESFQTVSIQAQAVRRPHEHQQNPSPIRPMATKLSEPSTQSAADRRSAEAELTALITKFAATQQELVGTVRRSLRKRLPTAHEVVYEYADSFVISFSPDERGYEGVLAIRGSAKGVDLYFNRGKELSDPDKLLRGSAKLVRFIHMESAFTQASGGRAPDRRGHRWHSRTVCVDWSRAGDRSFDNGQEAFATLRVTCAVVAEGRVLMPGPSPRVAGTTSSPSRAPRTDRRRSRCPRKSLTSCSSPSPLHSGAAP